MTKKLSREAIAGIRQRYADGVSLKTIKAEFNVSTGGIGYWVDGGPANGPDHLPPLPHRGRGRAGGGEAEAEPNSRRRAIINRVWRTASRQVRDIETRLRQQEQEPAERERDTRMMAVLVKTLRELAAFDIADLAKPKRANAQDAPHDHDDAVPADIDELRRELARRVD